jgi:outer membrane receptor protein involved in Fe transport
MRQGKPAATRLAGGALGVLAAVLASWAAAQEADEARAPQNAATVQEMQTIVVIGNAPLPGLGLPPSQVPANVQTADRAQIQRQHTLGISDYLNNNFSGVNVNETQDNPLQVDVVYHGYTASPLLGAPQGLSTYVDGVRVNESFGDTVNWDLIPEAAISTVVLIPGSNPLFGLNTLGGALSVQTRSGHQDPGTELQGYAGSFGRTAAEFATGGSRGAFDWFVAGNSFDEHGWRDLSPTHAHQLFGKVGWQTERSDLDLSYTWADNSMTGNGSAPQSMLAYRYASIYTAPDHTNNHLDFLNLVGNQFLAGHLLLGGNLYYRELKTHSNNGDLNDGNYLSEDYPGPPIDCSVPAGSLADNAYCSNGINRSARLAQRTSGAALQLTDSADLFAGRNQFMVGADYSHSSDSYGQQFDYATLAADRTATSNDNPFNPAETANSVSGVNEIWGLYSTDTWSPNELLHLTVSARYNHSRETLSGYSVDTDLGNFGDGFNEANPLSGDHVFKRLNPAVGFTLTPSGEATLYANFSESSRTPTVIELGCADPQAPCGLPNNFASDPDLNQVTSRNAEIGARGKPRNQSLDWSLDLFRTVNDDDIQFIATTTSAGYFANVGRTRRQGLDAALGGRWGALTWRASYSLVDATFQSGYGMASESNSTADRNGIIQVRPGDRIPLIPRDTGRLLLDYEISDAWDIGGTMVATSGACLRGNENNGNKAGGINAQGAVILGSGQVGGYAIVNLFSTARVSSNVDFFVRINNVLDRHYATAGFLGSNAFEPNGAFRADPQQWTNENSVSPGASRAAWAGVRLHWK